MRKGLQEDKDLAKERMKIARSSAGKVLIKDLESEIEAIRLKYRMINTNRHTNIVVAEFCRLQGKESGLIVQLEKWTGAKNIYERVDKELIMCQKELTVRDEQELIGRV